MASAPTTPVAIDSQAKTAPRRVFGGMSIAVVEGALVDG